MVTNQAAEPAPFLDILGDILPKGSLPQDQPGQVQPQFSGTTLSPGNPVATGSVLNPVKSEANAATLTAETNTPVTGGSQAGNNAAPNAVQQVVAGTRDALWDRAVSEGETEPQRNAGEPVEVAFAARIAARTPEPQVIAPNEAQAAIAASRFAGLDAATAAPAVAEEPVMAAASGFEGTHSDGNSSERSDTGLNASAGTGPTRVPSAVAGENGTATQTMAPDAQATAQPQASAAVVPQAAASRVLSIQATSGTMGARSAGTGQQGSNPGAGSSLFATAAPANAGVATGRGATDPKPASEERAAPPFEPQDDAAERAGEMVRAISLNLSSQDQSVQVRLSERAGELHVTVRTPDAGLTHGLREGLSDLVGRLEHGGYRAEAWRPGGNDSSDRGQDSPSRRGSSQQQNDGSKGSGQQENSQDSESDAQTPQWMGELESSIQRSNSVWPASAIR